ncbi:MAG: class D sortase [Acidobacteriia bacterium]|nr:class D sortase [Terriglobia bacterium]
MIVHRKSSRRILAGLEWLFLLLGLVALDCYVWINTSALLYQSYEDWAFDESLRGLKPAVPGFITAELERIFLGGTTSENAGTPEISTNSEKGPLPQRPLLPDMLIGRLRIPRLHLTVMVREGAGERTLRRAVGHIPGTALPGRLGNVALAGHRDTFFRSLRGIRKNDVIDFQTGKGAYQYLVESTQIVGPRDVEVLNASGGETLTLVTCYPFYYIGSAPKRFIVRAVRVGVNPRSQPQPGS